MKYRNYLTQWSIEGDRVRLQFLDNSVLYVTKTDFDRAFGCIINLTMEEVLKDFAIKNNPAIGVESLMEYLSYLATIRCTNTAIPVNDVTFTCEQIHSAYQEMKSGCAQYQAYRAAMFDKDGVRYEPS